METLVGTSTAPTTLFPRIPFNPQSGTFPSAKRVWCRGIQNGYSSSSFSVSIAFSIGRRSSQNFSPLIAMAKKGNEKKKKEKVDSHSFAPKPDEATGPFPEAVLLREVRHYEVVYLIHQDYDKQVENVNSKIEDFLKEKKGKLWRFSDWGMRRLAYKIKKATHAHYILMNFELESQWINEFKTMLDQDERVIRHLVIKRDKAITEDCPPPPEFHTLRGEGDDEYEEEDDDVEYDDDDDGDEEEWDDDGDDEDEEEIELQDFYDDEGDVEEENMIDDDDVAEIKQPARVETSRKKDKKIEKAVR